VETAADLIGYANSVAFTGLGLLAVRLWWRERTRAAAWFALTFITLAAVVIAGRLLPDDPSTTVEQTATKALVAMLLLAPYWLYRFTAYFRRPPKLIDATMSALVAALIVWTFLLSSIPAEGEPRSREFSTFLVGYLALWTLLSLVVATNLWRAGRREPHLARQRMRMLSVGSLGISAALLLAGATTDSGHEIAVITALLALASVIAYYLGFAPPEPIRMFWRQAETQALRGAILKLMSASTEVEVTDSLLPHVAAIFGAHSAALIDHSGRTVGAHNLTPVEASDLIALAHGHEPSPNLVNVEMPFGRLVVWTTPYAPFFGGQDTDLLRSLGAIAELALERARQFERLAVQKQQLEEVNRDLIEAQAVAQLGSWEWFVEEDRISWSEELFRIFGVSPENFEASYEGFLKLIHPDDRDKIGMIVDHAFRTGEFKEIVHRVVWPDGTIRWVRSRGRVMKSRKGEVERMIGTAQDITERILADEYQRGLREAEIRQKQALELNDNIVQGLAVAGMALEIGEDAKAKDAIARTMSAAQSIITGLLKGNRVDDEIRPGDLIRSSAAQPAEDDIAASPNESAVDGS
jgi:PAS domain S-box-containing protein